MNEFLKNIKRSYLRELPIIRLYAILYLIGVLVGAIAAVSLRDNFTYQAQFLFSPENRIGFVSALLQQIFFFGLLYFLGLTIIGIPLVPIYPLYKGFSIGLLLTLSVIISGVRGLFIGTLAFFAQNLYYTILGYFVCYSSARLSVALFELLKGHSKHGASYREFLRHTYCFFVIIPFLTLGSFWESNVVASVLNLF